MMMCTLISKTFHNASYTRFHMGFKNTALRFRPFNCKRFRLLHVRFVTGYGRYKAGER